MKEFNEVLERNHPHDSTIVRSAMLIDNAGWLVVYDVGDRKFEPWVMRVVAGQCQWAHPVDYDVTRLGLTKVETDHSVPQGFKKAHPYDTDENIGSCEPSPRIDWDKTQSTWHTDTKAGRYSVRRVQKRGPFGAFLNNKPIAVDTSMDVQVVKRAVELRIVEARRIAKTEDVHGKDFAGNDCIIVK